MKLTKAEMETVIRFDEELQRADIYTHNRALIRKLMKYAEDRPEQCKIERASHDGQAIDATVPKTWLRIKPPRISSPAQIEAARAALSKTRI